MKTLTTKVDMIVSLIAQGQNRCQQLTGHDPIYLPLAKDDFVVLNREPLSLQAALADYLNDIRYTLPQHKLLHSLSQIPLQPKKQRVPVPIKGARTVFLDGSGKTHKAVVVWKQTDLSDWQSSISVVEGSTQIAELSAALHAFQLFSTEPLNVVANCAYVVGIVQCIADAMIKDVNNKQLFSLLLKSATLLKNRVHVYFIMHIRSHTTLPGPITEGNAVADKLTMAAVLPRSSEQAQLSHDFFHQNASSFENNLLCPEGKPQKLFLHALTVNILHPYRRIQE